MSPLDLLLTGLAAFYVSYAISNTSGPFHVFDWLKEHVPLGGLTSCIICLSPWSGALFYWLLTTPAAWIVWVFAGAGFSVFVYRYTGGQHTS